MNPEMSELVLQEILSEQKETNLINGQMAAYIKTLSDKFETLEKKIEKQAKSGDTDLLKSVQQLQDSLTEIKSLIAAKPDTITHTKIFQLFPAINIREYYQVYGNIIKWLALFGSVCLIVRLVRDLLEKQGYL